MDSGSVKLNIAFFRALELVSLHSVLFYVNTFVLMPRLMDHKKYGKYFISLVFLAIIAVGVLYLLNYHVKPFMDIMPTGRGARQGIPSNMVGDRVGKELNRSVLITRSVMRNFSSIVAIILLSIVYKMFFQKISEERRSATTRNEHLISELKFLKSQINPHFLFNALNNIYALVHLKQERASPMLMKLSEMLRYDLYECDDEWVPLEKEVTYINNYIELQQLKTERHQRINADFEEADMKTLIPPLLLIPFIENSFKHSRIEDVQTGWVSMQLNTSDQQIRFQITNSIPVMRIFKDETGGIGLGNAKRRLELLYPNKFELIIEETQDEFRVSLEIDIR